MLLLGSIRSIMIICIRTDNVFFSKTYPSFLTVKEGSTSLTKPLSCPTREDVTALQCWLFYLSVSPARRAPHPNQAFPSRKGKDVTALRCSEPLRSKVGGPSKVCAILCGMGPPGVGLMRQWSKPSPCCAGWDRLGIAVYRLQLIVYSLRLISWLFVDNLQISYDFLGGFEKIRLSYA